MSEFTAAQRSESLARTEAGDLPLVPNTIFLVEDDDHGNTELVGASVRPEGKMFFENFLRYEVSLRFNFGVSPFEELSPVLVPEVESVFDVSSGVDPGVFPFDLYDDRGVIMRQNAGQLRVASDGSEGAHFFVMLEHEACGPDAAKVVPVIKSGGKEVGVEFQLAGEQSMVVTVAKEVFKGLLDKERKTEGVLLSPGMKMTRYYVSATADPCSLGGSGSGHKQAEIIVDP